MAAAFSLDPPGRRPARRRSFRALSQLQTQLQRQLAEPPPMSTRAAAWWPAVAQLERVAASVTQASVALDAGAPAPAPDDVEGLRRMVRALEDAPGRSCPEHPGDDVSPVLLPVAADVGAACRLLARAAALSRRARATGADGARS